MKPQPPPSDTTTPPAPDLLTTADLAKRLGISTTALWRWRQNDAVLARCILRQTKRSTWWSVKRLREAGYLS